MTIPNKYSVLCKMVPVPCDSHEGYNIFVVDELGACSRDHAAAVLNEWQDNCPREQYGHQYNYFLRLS